MKVLKMLNPKLLPLTCLLSEALTPVLCTPFIVKGNGGKFDIPVTTLNNPWVIL